MMRGKPGGKGELEGTVIAKALKQADLAHARNQNEAVVAGDW